jgi:hypothetical protein
LAVILFYLALFVRNLIHQGQARTRKAVLKAGNLEKGLILKNHWSC